MPNQPNSARTWTPSESQAIKPQSSRNCTANDDPKTLGKTATNSKGIDAITSNQTKTPSRIPTQQPKES